MEEIIKYGRFFDSETNSIVIGRVDEEEKIVYLVDGDYLGDKPHETGKTTYLANLVYLPPVECIPQIFAVGFNYFKHGHVPEMKEPYILRKSQVSLVGHRGVVLIPDRDNLNQQLHNWGTSLHEDRSKKAGLPYVDPEPELAIIYGYDGKPAGFTIGNDFTERWLNVAMYRMVQEGKICLSIPECQCTCGEIAPYKSFPGFSAMGPYLYRFTDGFIEGIYEMTISLRINDREYTGDRVSRMILQHQAIGDYIERCMNLERVPPRTVIYTGTPIIGFNADDAELSREPLKAGDEVVVRIDDFELVNYVR